MAENPIRYGIIGCAWIAAKIARAIDLAPNSTLYAIGSRSIQKAELFAAKNGVSKSVKIYGSYEQVIDDPCVDVVYLPLPTSLHVHWAVLAANRKKHLLVEKPTALDVAELDRILGACELNGVQFMDGSMWLHHPRTHELQKMMADSSVFGNINFIYTTSTFCETGDFLENNIRVKPDLDALGALGDLGWYCIGAILWAKNYRLPVSVTALPDVKRNSAGVILSCSASFAWDQSDKTTAAFYCSFLSYTSMDISICSFNTSLHLDDYIIPHQENSASFDIIIGGHLADLSIGWNKKAETVEVISELPQEALMVKELASLVDNIRKLGCQPDGKWAEISRKTQLVTDAVKKSIDIGCKVVYL